MLSFLDCHSTLTTFLLKFSKKILQRAPMFDFVFVLYICFYQMHHFNKQKIRRLRYKTTFTRLYPTWVADKVCSRTGWWLWRSVCPTCRTPWTICLTSSRDPSNKHQEALDQKRGSTNNLHPDMAARQASHPFQHTSLTPYSSSLTPHPLTRASTLQSQSTYPTSSTQRPTTASISGTPTAKPFTAGESSSSISGLPPSAASASTNVTSSLYSGGPTTLQNQSAKLPTTES